MEPSIAPFTVPLMVHNLSAAPTRRVESRVESKKMWHFDLSSVVEIPLYACKASRLARWFLPFTFASRRQGHLPPKLISHSSHYFPRKKKERNNMKNLLLAIINSHHAPRRGARLTLIQAESSRHWACGFFCLLSLATLPLRADFHCRCRRSVEKMKHFTRFCRQTIYQPNLRSTHEVYVLCAREKNEECKVDRECKILAEALSGG